MRFAGLLWLNIRMQSGNDEKEVRDFVQQWMEASRAGNTAAVLEMMTDDVVFMVPGRAPFGKKEFAAQSGAMKGVKVDGHATTLEALVVGDWAWMRNQLEVRITPPNGTEIVKKGFTLTVLKRTHGKWQIARDANLLS